MSISRELSIMLQFLVLINVIACKPRTNVTSSDLLEATKPSDLATLCLGQNKQLTKEERTAISEYTGSAYTMINDALRNNTWNQDKGLKLQIERIACAVNKIREDTPCDARRYVEIPHEVFEAWRKEGYYPEKAFASSTRASTAPNFLSFKTDVIFIKTPRCPYIAKLSTIPGEEEVLFPPGATFKISDNGTSFQTGGVYHDVLHVEEILKGVNDSSILAGNQNGKIGGKDTANSSTDDQNADLRADPKSHPMWKYWPVSYVSALDLMGVSLSSAKFQSFMKKYNFSMYVSDEFELNKYKQYTLETLKNHVKTQKGAAEVSRQGVHLLGTTNDQLKFYLGIKTERFKDPMNSPICMINVVMRSEFKSEPFPSFGNKKLPFNVARSMNAMDAPKVMNPLGYSLRFEPNNTTEFLLPNMGPIKSVEFWSQGGYGTPFILQMIEFKCK